MKPESEPDGDTVDFVDEHTVQDDFRGIVSKRTPRDSPGFAVNVLPAGAPGFFVDWVVNGFAERYDPDDFRDGESVGVIFVDRHDPKTVFPIGVGDTVDVVRPEDDERESGTVEIIKNESTVLIRGFDAIGNFIVDPSYVVEVTDRVGVDE